MNRRNFFTSFLKESPEREALAADLERAGFGRHNVERALDWLADLAGERSRPDMSSRALRIFSAEELEHISADCRGYLLQLERDLSESLAYLEGCRVCREPAAPEVCNTCTSERRDVPPSLVSGIHLSPHARKPEGATP
jgi:hypothetical protein